MSKRLFELGKYWIGRVQGSDRLYQFWYDDRVGEIRRRTLKTRDIEQAKIRLAAIVLKEGSGKAEDPGKVALITVLSNYREKHSDRLTSSSNVKVASEQVLDFMGATAKVGEFTPRRQKDFIKKMRADGFAVGTIATRMAAINAALNFAMVDDSEDGDGTGALLTMKPRVIYQPDSVAEALGEPTPGPRNWHPTLDQIAKFINATTPDEFYLVRFAVLILAFSARHQAALEIGPFSLDRRYRLINLNPTGRRQTKKHRPTLPVPDPLWPLLDGEWSDGSTFTSRRSKTRKRNRPVGAHVNEQWERVVERAELPAAMIPHSLRHFMATELRHAHNRYGVDRVPREEREMWMGHRKESTNDGYGIFEPDYLASAKAAVEAILLALDAKLERPLFRQVSAKNSVGQRSTVGPIDLKRHTN